MAPLPFHPLAGLFPLIDGDEFNDLAADIATHGLREPIVLYDGAILDGRNRYAACLSVGVAPTFVEYDGEDALAFVLSLNLHRRHLSQSQKAALALDILPMAEAEAKMRRAATEGRPAAETEHTNMLSLGQPRKAAADVARMVGVSQSYVESAKAVALAAPDLMDDIRRGDMTVTEAKREINERRREARREDNRALVAATPAPEVVAAGARFATIVIDPPWDWGDEGDADQLGRARPTYATMTIDELAALPVGSLADIDCHLYLWITNRSLPKGARLLEAWGFRYVTCLTWCKPSIGMGNYFRGSTEHVLFAVKGSQPLKRRDVGTWFAAPRPGRHSAKPPEFHDLVESCSPGPYLEMFARSSRDGWTPWGAEAQAVDYANV